MPFLSLALETNPQGIALEDEGGSLTYQGLAENAGKVARWLGREGVGDGDTVALQGPPNARLLAALHGIWMTGAVAAPMNPSWTPREEERALELLAPALVLNAEGVQGPGSAPRDHRPLLAEHAVAARLLTSGTSGQPWVVELTVGNLMASARAARERLGLRADDCWLGSLSLAHVGGLALVTRATALGSTVFLSGGFDPFTFLELAEAGTITHASLVPTMLHRVLEALGARKAPVGLRCLLIGGAAAPGELVERALAAGFPLALTYGLTEASSQVATAPPALVGQKPGTVGASLPGVELRLTQEGEILVRGPTVVEGSAGEDGWLRTGDLGRLDEDGHLWVTGRCSDRIISGGVNVDPEEVATVLMTHPGVAEAAVVGLPEPEWGERVVAVVVRASGRHATEEELHRLVRAALSPAKRPKVIRFIGAIPLNANGKVDRERIRDLFR